MNDTTTCISLAQSLEFNPACTNEDCIYGLTCQFCEGNLQLHDSLQRKSIFGEYPMFHDDEAKVMITTLYCLQCKKDSDIWFGDGWKPVSQLLSAEGMDGFKQVTSNTEKVQLFILSQICHNQHDLDPQGGETPFMPARNEEFAKLLWHEGQLVGFYTLKEKGTQFGASEHDSFVLPMVDTVYIRGTSRREGFGTKILEEILSQFPAEDLGFSEPISESMLKVLEKYLRLHPDHRDHLWGCCYTGAEGYRRNLWLHIRRLKAEKIKLAV